MHYLGRIVIVKNGSIFFTYSNIHENILGSNKNEMIVYKSSVLIRIQLYLFR